MSDADGFETVMSAQVHVDGCLDLQCPRCHGVFRVKGKEGTLYLAELVMLVSGHLRGCA